MYFSTVSVYYVTSCIDFSESVTFGYKGYEVEGVRGKKKSS